ncbi:alpha/beta fold hydrolase [Membranihabitans marinus]|uniref:alpha/beta fold hydrolase n=1 Tax=Membranihabitans marinus TaxID=1227546 RepID=UPI001F37A6CB|nr:alpha/beta fold hydrolase [Membranihabitans marinus]
MISKTLVVSSLFFFIALFASGLCSGSPSQFQVQIPSAGVDMDIPENDTIKRQKYLEEILNVLPEDRPGFGRVSYLDSTFKDWLSRTGELPPDFDRLPSIVNLPNPLMIDEGVNNIAVSTPQQWQGQRQWMKKALQYYITGSFPTDVGEVKAKIISEKMDGEVKLQLIELRFGPNNAAKLTLEMMIPPGSGPFPVFMTQWNHREWAQVAVRRGYIGCVYAGADAKDDTEEYSKIWADQYDFSRLMRRAFGCFRAIDYLYTLDYVDREKIGLTGHSRNGKQSLMAAAFDERIKAVIPSSGGTGAEVPWRYCSHKYDVEDLALLTCAQPSWFHPRLRFFVGREDKLPVDQNHFMALIAPRGLMLSSAKNESASNYWGIEQAYLESQKVYRFLGNEDGLALRLREGLHSVSARDMEDYIDFFDYVFGRHSSKPPSTMVSKYDYPTGKSDQMIASSEPSLGDGDRAGEEDLVSIDNLEIYRSKTKEKILDILGNPPPGVTNLGPMSIKNGGRGEVSFGHFLSRPGATENMSVMAISPYNGFGDNLFGYLYYPKAKADRGEKMPVVIYLHEYDYSKGFSSMGFDHDIPGFFRQLVDQGFAVMAYDMIGFGNRIDEGKRFYQRYPDWSKMGKMVIDVQGALDGLIHMKEIDSDQIFVAGYALGATVGLYAAALDDRIAGLLSVAGFTPLRPELSNPSINDGDKGYDALLSLSHLHGLIPRLGNYIDHRDKLPYDYDDLLMMMAGRPTLVIAPQWDREASWPRVKSTVHRVNNRVLTWDLQPHIELLSPMDYNRFSPEMKEYSSQWLYKQLRGDQ